VTDLAHQLGQLCCWVAVLGLLALGGYCVLEGVREARAWARTSKAIGRIGECQTKGVVERLTPQMIAERKR
jgi:hypothetical protein